MAYDLSGQALYPVSAILELEEFPLADYFPTEMLADVFGGLYSAESEAYWADDGLHLNFCLAFEGELALRLPGLPGVTASIAAADMGWSALPAAFVIGPELSATIDELPLRLRFARGLLTPMLSRTEVSEAAELSIELGTVSLSVNALEFSITTEVNVTIPLCMLGDTGVLLQADHVILRLSPIVGLPEAAAALGLAQDWRGVYIEEAKVWLPEALGNILPDELSLTNSFIGDGGFSGNLSIDWSPALAANLFGISLALEHLGLTLALNQLTQLDLRGTLTFPALLDDSGEPAPIGFVIEAGTGGYRVVAGDIPPLKLGGLEVDLDGLSVGFDSTALKAVDIGGVVRVPGLKGSDGRDAEIGIDVEYAAGVYALQASAFPALKLGPLEVALDSLDVRFDEAQLLSSALGGRVTIPGLEAAGGGPAVIEVRIAVGSDDFALSIQSLPPLRLAALEIELQTFAIEFGKSKPLAADIAGRLTIPGVEDAAGQPVAIGFTLDFGPQLFRIEALDVPALVIGGLTVQLTEFSIGFDARGIVASETSIEGTVRVPAFQNAAGGPLDIGVAVDLSDGFEVTADVRGGELEVLEIAGLIRVALSKLSVGTGQQGVRFAVGGRIDNSLSIPLIEKLLPSSVVVRELGFRAPRDVQLDVELAWASGLTAGSDGDGGFAVDVPIGEIGGGLAIQSIHLGFRDAGTAYEFAIAFRGATLELGPVIGTVDGLGVAAKLTPKPDGGNLGPLQVDLGFIPPTGIGLSLDAGAVKLGGFLGFEPDGYIGAAELTIADSFGLSVVGLLTTRMPDGSQGLSLLAIVSVQLPTPIHIAYGIFFAGAGGLLGLNRSVDIDRLSMGLRTGAADNILFPKDVVRNINAIVRDLREVFPPTKDQFVIGPMVLLTWSTPPLIKAKVGLLIEFPNPVSIAILGALRVALPTEAEAILDLKVAFLGAIELDKGLIRFDASIYDSFIGSGDWKFSIEGDLSLRISFGARKDFVNSVGGFHPLYSPPAYLHLPTPMRRMRITLLKDNPRLSMATYFAITSNTVQFGAELDFRFDVKAFSIVGDFGFDVLFQFSPFRFIAHVWASLALKAGGADVLTLKLDFQLEGATPWIASGSASFKVLFWEAHARFERTFGERAELPAPRVDVLPILLKEFSRPENWLGELPPASEQLVELRELAREPGEIVLDGSSTLRIAQGAVPLDMELERYGTAEPSDARRVIISGFRVGGADQAFDPASGDFAPAAYRALSDRDKLKAASFESRTSGVTMREDAKLDVGTPLARPLRYERYVSDLAPSAAAGGRAPAPERLGGAPPDPAARFARWASNGVIARSPGAIAARRRGEKKDAVKIEIERFSLARARDLQGVPGASGLLRSEAEELLRKLGSADHVIVPDYKARRAG